MITKEQYEEVFEDFIDVMIKQIAELQIDIHSLQQAIIKHQSDSTIYHLKYCYDDENGTYSYHRVSKKRIGF